MHSVSFTYDYETFFGDVDIFSCELEYDIVHEVYGEDADGRRGEWRSSLEPKGLTIVNGFGMDITAIIQSSDRQLHEELYNIGVEYANNAPIDFDSDGPDYERDNYE